MNMEDIQRFGIMPDNDFDTMMSYRIDKIKDETILRETVSIKFNNEINKFQKTSKFETIEDEMLKADLMIMESKEGLL